MSQNRGSRQVTALTTSQLRAFKSYAEVQALGANDAAITDFTPLQVSELTAEQFSAFRADQFASFTPNQLAAARADQIAVLSYDELAGVTATQISSLGLAQIAAFAPDEVAAIDPAQIGALPSAAFKQFSGIQLQALTTAQLANVSATSLASLSTDQLSYFRLSQAQSLSAPQLSQLSAAQQQALFSPPAVSAPTYTFVQTGTLDDPAFSSVQTNANGDLWALGANTANQYGRSIFKFTDGHWQQIKNVGATSIALDNTGSVWATAASGEIYHLASDGSGWNHIGGGALLSKIATGGGVLWGIGNDSGFNQAPGGLAVYRSTDGGQNWDRSNGYGVELSVDIDGNAYVVNEYGTLFHYDNYGTTYNQFNPIADGVSQVAAAPNGAVYARSTSGGAIAKFEFLPAGTYNRGVFDAPIGYGDAVALGGGGVGSNESVLAVQNGKVGSFNGYGGFSAIETRLLSVTATPDGKVFALAATSNANSAHPAVQWNGTSWDAVPLFNGAQPYLTNISASDDGSLWAVNSEGQVLHTDGNGVLQFTALPGNIYQVAASAAGGVWALSRSANAQGGGLQILHATDAYNWAQVFGGATSLAVDGSGSAWVVNNAGSIFKWDGTQFLAFSPVPNVQTVVASGTSVQVSGTAQSYELSGNGWSAIHNAAFVSSQAVGALLLGVDGGGRAEIGAITTSGAIANGGIFALWGTIRSGTPATHISGIPVYFGVGSSFGHFVTTSGNDISSAFTGAARTSALLEAYGADSAGAPNDNVFGSGAPFYQPPTRSTTTLFDVFAILRTYASAPTTTDQLRAQVDQILAKPQEHQELLWGLSQDAVPLIFSDFSSRLIRTSDFGQTTSLFNANADDFDIGGASDGQHIVTISNKGVQFHDISGNLIRKTATLKAFFCDGPNPPNSCQLYSTPTDPRIKYDSFANRWVVSALWPRAAGNTGSHLLAVSQSPDPLGAWTVFDYNGGGPNSTSDADQPRLAINGRWIIVDSSAEPQSLQVFDSASLYKIDPPPTLTQGVNWWSLVDPKGGYNTPASTYTSNPNGYLANYENRRSASSADEVFLNVSVVSTDSNGRPQLSQLGSFDTGKTGQAPPQFLHVFIDQPGAPGSLGSAATSLAESVGIFNGSNGQQFLLATEVVSVVGQQTPELIATALNLTTGAAKSTSIVVPANGGALASSISLPFEPQANGNRALITFDYSDANFYPGIKNAIWNLDSNVIEAIGTVIQGTRQIIPEPPGYDPNNLPTPNPGYRAARWVDYIDSSAPIPDGSGRILVGGHVASPATDAPPGPDNQATIFYGITGPTYSLPPDLPPTPNF